MEIKKALTFRASSVGDCLMGKYALEAIHEHYPQARLALVVANHGALMRDLFAAYQWLEVIEASRRSPKGVWYLLKHFWRSDFVLTQYAGKKGGSFSLASKCMARLLARRGGLVGFSDASVLTPLIYSHVVPMRHNQAPAALERDALATFGVSVPHAPSLKFVGEARKDAAPYVVVHMYAGNRGRGISPQTQRALLEALSQALPSTTLYISGGPADAMEAKAAAVGIEHTEVVAGRASLQEMMRILAGSAGVISLDTGMAHMSVQLGRPTLVLASCLGLHWWQPQQYDTVPAVYTNPEPGGHIYKDYPACMADIPLTEVARAAKRWIF